MSRLDDELKAAFRRVEPSADFAERVLARINNPPAPEPGFWEKLKNFLAPPVARWVAIGVATSLLVAIFASQYQRLEDAKTDRDETRITAQTQPEVKPEVKTDQPAPQPIPLPERGPYKVRQHVIKAQPVRVRAAAGKGLLAEQRKTRQQRIKAERAKEQLLLALQIASSTLNEANKVVRGDD